MGERAVTSLDKNPQTKTRGDTAPGRESRVGAQSDMVDETNNQQDQDGEDQGDEEEVDEEEEEEEEEEEDGEDEEDEDT